MFDIFCFSLSISICILSGLDMVMDRDTKYSYRFIYYVIVSLFIAGNFLLLMRALRIFFKG